MNRLSTKNDFLKVISFLILSLPLTSFAQEEAITSSGKVVLLFPDSTWKLKVVAQQTSKDSVQNDSLVAKKPEKQVKAYTDTATGFKGFMRPPLRLPALPEQSQGVYEFRLKIDKEGYVKEVITTHHGPNGQAESVMRNALTRLKFMHNGSAVPPLTDGMFRIIVPPGK